MKSVIIFDIEASCEDREINPRYNMETIEIGAVKLLNNRVIAEFQQFIEPEYIAELTPFCTNLTGITFENLKGKPGFLEVMEDFNNFIKGCEIFSCGDFDRKFLVNELKEKGQGALIYEIIANTINSSHTDLKKIYTKITSNKKAGMVGMAKALNIPLEGKHHRGIDDARNLANIYIKLQTIREKELKENINIDKLIEDINKNHYGVYEIRKNKDTFISIDFTNDTITRHNLLDCLDTWREVIIVDIEHRELEYLTKSELKILKKFTI